MRFIVIVRDENEERPRTERAFGVYRSFMAASADAKAWDGIVLPIESKDEGEPVKRKVSLYER